MCAFRPPKWERKCDIFASSQTQRELASVDRCHRQHRDARILGVGEKEKRGKGCDTVAGSLELNLELSLLKGKELHPKQLPRYLSSNRPGLQSKMVRSLRGLGRMTVTNAPAFI